MEKRLTKYFIGIWRKKKILELDLDIEVDFYNHIVTFIFSYLLAFSCSCSYRIHTYFPSSLWHQTSLLISRYIHYTVYLWDKNSSELLCTRDISALPRIMSVSLLICSTRTMEQKSFPPLNCYWFLCLWFYFLFDLLSFLISSKDFGLRGWQRTLGKSGVETLYVSCTIKQSLHRNSINSCVS